MSAHLPQPNHGILRLGLRRAAARTILHDAYSHVPLQVLRPLYLDDTGTAYLYVLNPCGGVLGGDTYTIDVTLEPDAHAYITTPSATKLYASPGAAATQQLDFTLHDGAVLTYLPDQTIPFANAAFQQHMTVRLGKGAMAFVGEILAPGRLARDEIFAYREYTSALRIETTDGDVLLVDHNRLYPQQTHLSQLGLWEDYTYLTTFYAVANERPEPTRLDTTLADTLHDILSDRTGTIGSATALPYGGIAVRCLTQNHTAASQALYQIWDVLRQHMLGYPAAPYRT